MATPTTALLKKSEAELQAVTQRLCLAEAKLAWIEKYEAKFSRRAGGQGYVTYWLEGSCFVTPVLPLDEALAQGMAVTGDAP
jgi:hypothetical protein